MQPFLCLSTLGKPTNGKQTRDAVEILGVFEERPHGDSTGSCGARGQRVEDVLMLTGVTEAEAPGLHGGGSSLEEKGL